MDRLETKATLAIDDAGMISGIAWPFGSPDRVGDVVEKGAFAGARPPKPMLFGHDPADPVGSWTDLVEDFEGFKVKGRLLVEDVARAREVRAVVQAGAIGGFASHVLQFLASSGLLDHGLKVRPMILPDRFIDHDTQPRQYAEAGLDAKAIVATALAALGRAESQARA